MHKLFWFHGVMFGLNASALIAALAIDIYHGKIELTNCLPAFAGCATLHGLFLRDAYDDYRWAKHFAPRP